MCVCVWPCEQVCTLPSIYLLGLGSSGRIGCLDRGVRLGLYEYPVGWF